MKTTKFLVLFSAIFGLTTASRASMGAAPVYGAVRSMNLAGEDHLCTGPTDVVYEYGNQTNPDGVKAGCDKLSQNLKAQADQQGDFMIACGGPVKFRQFGTEGDCTLWFRCGKTTEGNQVTIGYGDAADVIKLATDGLQGSGQSDNSSIVAVTTSIYCQSLQADWVVAL